MAVVTQNVAGDDYIYPSNSDNSDFEDSFRTIPDDISEVFDPPLAIPSDIKWETENVEPNKTDGTGDEPNCYGLQETPIYNYYGDAENEEDFQDGWYWAYWPSEQDTELEMGNGKWMKFKAYIQQINTKFFPRKLQTFFY